VRKGSDRQSEPLRESKSYSTLRAPGRCAANMPRRLATHRLDGVVGLQAVPRAREGSLHECAETPALFAWPAARSRGLIAAR